MRLNTLLLAALSFVLATATLRATDRLDLVNGDRLHGKWLGSTDTHIRFRTRWSDQDLTLLSGHVRALIATRPHHPLPRGDFVVLRLHDGSQLSGTQFSAKGDVFQWTTPWGQEVRLRNSAVAEIALYREEDVLFSEPGTPDEWTHQDGGGNLNKAPLREAGGRLIFPSNIGIKQRQWNVALPDRFRVDFHYSALIENNANFQFSLFGNRNAGNQSNQLHVLIQPESIRLQWPREDARRSMEMQSFKTQNGVHTNADFSFFVDTPASEIHVFFAKKQLGTLRGPWIQGLKNNPNLSFTLISGNMTADLVLKQLRILAWNGRLPSAEAANPEAGELRVHLRDGSIHILRDEALGPLGLEWSENDTDVRHVAYAEIEKIDFPPSEKEGPHPQAIRVFAGWPGDMYTLIPEASESATLKGSMPYWITAPEAPYDWIGLMLFHATPAAESAPTSLLRLLNGDRLTLLTPRMEKGILYARSPWLAPDTPELQIPLHFAGSWFNVSGMSAENVAPHLLLDLSNGDSVTGQLLSLEAEHIQIQTSWKQHSTLDRSFVNRLTFHQKNERILDRIGPATAWSHGRSDNGKTRPPEITGQGATFYTNGSIGRRLAQLPQRFFLDFTIRPESPQYSVAVALSTSLGYQDNHSMSFNLGQYNLYYSLSRPRNAPLQSWHSSTFQGGQLTPQNRRFGILGDNVSRNYTLYVDGVPAHRWTLPKDRKPALSDYRWLVLACQYAGAPTHIESLSLTSLPLDVDLDLPTVSPGKIRALFRNGDILIGDLARFQEGAILLRDKEAPELRVPTERLFRLELPPVNPKRIRRTSRDVAVVLADAADQMTLALQTWNAQGFTFVQEGWKEPLRIPSANLLRLRFNIHARQRRDESLLESNDWLDLL
jgi:hypothetical protein